MSDKELFRPIFIALAVLTAGGVGYAVGVQNFAMAATLGVFFLAAVGGLVFR